MPVTPERLTIDPRGITVTVTIYDQYNQSMPAYTASGGDTAHDLPELDISVPTDFWLTAGGWYRISALVGAVEVAGETLEVDHGVPARYELDLNQPELVAVISATGGDSLPVGTTSGTVAAGDDARFPTSALGDAAYLDVGTTIGTVAAGDDARFPSGYGDIVTHDAADFLASDALNGYGDVVTHDASEFAASDVLDGLGGAATLDVGNTTGTVAAGDDARFPAGELGGAALLDVGVVTSTVAAGDDARFPLVSATVPLRLFIAASAAVTAYAEVTLEEAWPLTFPYTRGATPAVATVTVDGEESPATLTINTASGEFANIGALLAECETQVPAAVWTEGTLGLRASSPSVGSLGSVALSGTSGVAAQTPVPGIDAYAGFDDDVSTATSRTVMVKTGNIIQCALDFDVTALTLTPAPPDPLLAGQWAICYLQPPAGFELAPTAGQIVVNPLGYYPAILSVSPALDATGIPHGALIFGADNADPNTDPMTSFTSGLALVNGIADGAGSYTWVGSFVAAPSEA